MRAVDLSRAHKRLCLVLTDQWFQDAASVVLSLVSPTNLQSCSIAHRFWRLELSASHANSLLISHNSSTAICVCRDRLGSVQTHRNGHDKNLLDKVWVFSAYHRLEPIRERLFDTIEPGKKSVLSVLTSNHHVSKNLVSSCQPLSLLPIALEETLLCSRCSSRKEDTLEVNMQP